MDRVIYTAMTGASHALTQQAGMANNMANATTPGFRSEMHSFLAVPIQGDGLPTRAFVVDASVMSDFKPGTLRETGRALDVAVNGEGFITLSMPDGTEAYTRNGSFSISANGQLISSTGIPVKGTNGLLAIPPDSDVVISDDGTISATSRNTPGSVQVVGALKLVNPPEHALERGSDGLFRTKPGMDSEDASKKAYVKSGYLEGSNVDMAAEMVSMISVARQFELQLRVITMANENDRVATKVLSQSPG